jgi:hypothetical protein
MWLYARGVALAARRDFARAATAADTIEMLERTADFKMQACVHICSPLISIKITENATMKTSALTNIYLLRARRFQDEKSIKMKRC